MHTEVRILDPLPNIQYIMSKSYRDTANHFRHHLKTDEPVFHKSKRRYTEDDIPENVAHLMGDQFASDRHGNNRKFYAKQKVSDRRIERRKLNRESYDF